jgi:hypothetical protein
LLQKPIFSSSLPSSCCGDAIEDDTNAVVITGSYLSKDVLFLMLIFLSSQIAKLLPPRFAH